MMTQVVRTWAHDAALFVRVLRLQDPSWRSESVPVAGGHLVLSGPGMYVNRALGVGLDAPLTATEFELIESRSSALGLDAAIEITPVTHSQVRRQAEARGYVATRTVSAVQIGLDAVGDLDGLDRPPVDMFVIEPAADQVAVWQATSALGWGHSTAGSRRASDAFASVAAAIDGAGFLVARDAATGTPVGCASLSVRNRVATLSAMSTVPAERRRGVQAALVEHRLRLARDAGCVVATSTVDPDGTSARNLWRHGLAHWFDVTTLTRPSVLLPG